LSENKAGWTRRRCFCLGPSLHSYCRILPTTHSYTRITSADNCHC